MKLYLSRHDSSLQDIVKATPERDDCAHDMGLRLKIHQEAPGRDRLTALAIALNSRVDQKEFCFKFLRLFDEIGKLAKKNVAHLICLNFNE